jgi:hypothetical protein
MASVLTPAVVADKLAAVTVVEEPSIITLLVPVVVPVKAILKPPTGAVSEVPEQVKITWPLNAVDEFKAVIAEASEE